MKIKISNGNMKLGTIANMSLTPGVSCSPAACATCYKEGCYACKSYKAYKTVKNAWDTNTDLAINHLDVMRDDLTVYFAGLNAPRFFRIHVGSDFISKKYAEMWADVARMAPHTNSLAFTKQFDNIRGVEFPENVSIVLSDWPGIEIPADLREKYSVAWIDDGRECVPANAAECPGNCETCGVCWSLARMGIDVKFRKH